MTDKVWLINTSYLFLQEMGNPFTKCVNTCGEDVPQEGLQKEDAGQVPGKKNTLPTSVTVDNKDNAGREYPHRSPKKSRLGGLIYKSLPHNQTSRGSYISPPRSMVHDAVGEWNN